MADHSSRLPSKVGYQTWPKPTSPDVYHWMNKNSRQWSPDVNVLLATPQWLKLHGLKKYRLELKQILSSIGFKHSEEYVPSVEKPIKANYSKELFPKYAYADGTIYNLLATSEKLRKIECELKQLIELYQERLEWLTSASRLMFGVIQEQSVSVILDLQCSSEEELDLIKNAFSSLVKEQLLFISRFNFIRCASETESWQNESMSVSTDSVEGVLSWIQKLKQQPLHDISCTVDGLVEASKDFQVESIYLCTDGFCSDSTREILKRRIRDVLVPVHVVAFNVKSSSALKFLQETAKLSGGRFHKFLLKNNGSCGKMISKSLARSDLTDTSTGYYSSTMDIGVRKDILDLWEELDTARNTLAKIESIQEYITEQDRAVSNQASAPVEYQEAKTEINENELYMSSKDWLKKHSLKSRKLGFYDLLENIAFRHCDGVVELPHSDNLASAKSKLVNARYCDKFAHVRWKDGQIFHVYISSDVHRNYEKRIMAKLDSYKKRVQWLQKGSRELFGTIIEDQVTILIDTSASMSSRLFLVKDKLYQLLQEQIKLKQKFNLIKFDSQVQGWRSRLVDCDDRNIDSAWQWIKGLVVGGSTNTLGALELALSDPLCSAIYLLTDGRPDQPSLTILSQIHLQDPVPIHTISFNCADESANAFLCKLSENTGGRFHYFSENEDNKSGPNAFESEDLRLIKEEIESGINDLDRLTRLRNWCAQLDWYGSNSDKTLAFKVPQRPSSAPLPRRQKKTSGSTLSKPGIPKKMSNNREHVKPKSKEISRKESFSSNENELLKCESTKSENSFMTKSDSRMKESLLESTLSLKGSVKVEKKKKKTIFKEKNPQISAGKNTDKREVKEIKSLTSLRNVSSVLSTVCGGEKHEGSCGFSPNKTNVDRPSVQWLRNHKVLARNCVDGLYYKGVLRVNVNSRFADVAFCDFESQIVPHRFIIPNEGALPCPSLKVGDYVLVKTIRERGIPCYVPGVLYVVPLRRSKATSYYTVIHYNGKKSTSLRKNIVKISQSRYTFTCRYIKDCEDTINKSSSVSVFSTKRKKKDLSDENGENDYKIDSVDNSRSEFDGETSNEKVSNVNVNKKGNDEDVSLEDDDSSRSQKISIMDELENIKQALLETQESQQKSIQVHQGRFHALQAQIEITAENQRAQQEELKKRYEELQVKEYNVEGLDEDGKEEQLEDARKLLKKKRKNLTIDVKKENNRKEELNRKVPAEKHELNLQVKTHCELVNRKKEKNLFASKSNSSASGSDSSSDDVSSSGRSTEQPEMSSQDQSDKLPSKFKFHVSAMGKEACLWTKGSHGLLISRVPFEKDTAVENRPVLTRLKSGVEVLARWSDDGWYYRGTVRDGTGDNYFVEDSVGNMEEITRQNIISDEDDARNTVEVNDAVVALHPGFPFSYAPGVVISVDKGLLYKVRFYDGHEDVIPREEVYYVTRERFLNDVDFIVHCEESLVGQAVVARNDVDGLFYLANIIERVGSERQYVIQWMDGSAQVQRSSFIFGAHTKRHQLAVGDRVLALSSPDRGLYEPGWITSVNGKKLTIKLSMGKGSCVVDSLMCFWLSLDYYDRIVDYITKKARK